MNEPVLKPEKEGVTGPALVIRLRGREVARVILGSRMTRVEFSIPASMQQSIPLIRYLGELAKQNNSELSIGESGDGGINRIDIVPPLPSINAPAITRKILSAIPRYPEVESRER